MRPLRLVWVYPDLLSTYGDRGNVLVLERRARLRGIPVEIVEVNSDQQVPRDGDIYLMGGGEDLPQTLATRRLLADGGLHAAAERGAVVFAVCAGYQMMGVEFGGADDQSVQGLGLLDIRSGRGESRAVGEIVADVDPGLNVGRLTGFENHQGVTRLGPGVRPLARTRDRHRQRRRNRGLVRGPGTRHLPARPGPRPQPEPGRPAALLGGRPPAAVPAGGRGTRQAPPRRAPRRSGPGSPACKARSGSSLGPNVPSAH